MLKNKLFRADKFGDLELFDCDPGNGWTFVGNVDPSVTADVDRLLQRQDRLGDREDKQHRDLLKTRNELDAIACKLDEYTATPEKILAAVAKARRPMDQDAIAPPPPKQGVKLSAEEFLALFHRADRKRRGLE